MSGIIMPRMALILRYVSTICLITLLASCSSHRGDGPPSFYVNVDGIPNATPKPEPLAKYGNKPYYYVFGKRYKVLKSAKHYEATGTASWYGTKFHSRKTSSGERYDMLAMTAAHKSLPLPTYVQVTNLRNGRQVIVKVNDRGPFVGDRLIDLSYVAARKLGMYGNGTAPVKIKAIDPYQFYADARQSNQASTTGSRQFSNPAVTGSRQFDNPYPKKVVISQTTRHHYQKRIQTVKSSAKIRSIYVQLGAFKNKANALKLKKQVYTLTRTQVEIATLAHSTLYRVRIGPLDNEEIVNRLMAHLAANGFKPTKVIGS